MKKGAKIKNLVKQLDLDHDFQLIVYGDGNDVHIGFYDPESSHILYVVQKDDGDPWMREIDVTIAGADVHAEIVCCRDADVSLIIMEAIQMGFDPSNRTIARDDDGFYRICPATVHDILLRPVARMRDKEKKMINAKLCLDDATKECEDYINALVGYLMTNYRMSVNHRYGRCGDEYVDCSVDQFLVNAILSKLSEDERDQINPMVIGYICYQWYFYYRF